MSLSHDELIYLMAYVDGQVDDDELPEVEVLIAKNEEARKLVAQLGAVGDWVRASQEEKSVAAAADTIVDVVMTEAEALGGAKVITLERERARTALNRQRVKEFGALIAFAAVFALLWLSPSSQSGTPEPEVVAKANPDFISPAVPSSQAAPAPADSSPALAVGSDEGVNIEGVDSPHQVSVFYLPPPTSGNAASVVVWIGDEEVH